jgi:hypothetical protein
MLIVMCLERDVAFQERWSRKRERCEAHANMVSDVGVLPYVLRN